VNGATLTADRNGNVNSAYSFDGVDDFIQFNTTKLPDLKSDRTISIWILKQNNNSPWTQTALSYGSSSKSNAVMIGVLSNNIAIQGWADDISITQTSSNNWENITFTISQEIGKIYYNGKLIKSQAVPTWNTLLSVFIVGSRCDLANSYFFGKIDDIAIYNRALNQQEITALYTSTPLCTNPTATITPQGNTTFCQGGFVNLNASTGANYTYEWYNNGQLINGAASSVYQAKASSNYTVKVIDGACNSTSAATMVTVNPLPNVTLNALNQFTLKNASPIQLVASPSGGTFSGDGVQGSIFTPGILSLGKKTITYNYTSLQGCSGKASSNTIIADTLGNICSTYDTLKVKFKLTTGIKSNQYTTMNVYPNPTSDVIIIDASDVAALNGYSYKLVDAQGKEVYNALVNNAKTEISLKSFGKAGVYILHVVDANNTSIQTKQLVLE
jgi:hypothetical protein